MGSRSAEIIRILKKRYKPKGRGEVGRSIKDPFKVLVSAVISQRNRDEVTEKVAGGLLAKAGDARGMVKLGKDGITKSIRSANYYKTKADRIYRLSKIVSEKYGGKVPSSREELMGLPGVGGKTADIVMLVSHGSSVVPVDTHVSVIARRLGWTAHTNEERIREDLHAMFPESMRGYVNLILVEFGKDICRKHKPKCGLCPVEKLCPYTDKNL